jgi:Fe-S cluster assembly iron-binding protein IscA
MLILTSSATKVIRSVVDGSEFPDGGGLRIASTHNGTENFTVQPAAGPETGDQVVEDGGARVFLEPSAATVLGNTVLDADVDENGQIQFLLTAQVGES